MKRLSLATALTLVLVLAIVGVASAITNGTPDDGNHPYVGLLVFDTLNADGVAVPTWRCSGSLIAPNVVLTAAHCTEGAVAARIWVQPDVTSAAAPSYPGPGGSAVEGIPYVYPGYESPFAPGIVGFSKGDVGIVVLDQPIAVDRYAQLPEAGLVDTLRNKTPVDFVGYGVQYQAKIPGNQLPQPPPYYRWTGPRIRMYAPSTLVSGNFSWSDMFLRLAMNPGGGSGGTCFGDSGGPDLLGGTDTVLGVNSYVTNSNCSGNGYSQRVDLPEVLDWINSFLP